MKSVFVALSAAVVGAVISFSVVGSAQGSKTPSAVAAVSGNRILLESTHGRSEAARIQQLQQQRTGELRAKQQALESVRQQLSTTADSTQRSELLQKEQQLRTDLERSTQQAQVELQTLQRDVNNDMQRRVRAVLDEMMKGQGYQLVLNTDTSVIWSTPEVDLTAAVIARMNGQ